jgi:hypothetical protein
MKDQWIIRIFLVIFIIILLPRSLRVIRYNQVALFSYHCEDWKWLRDEIRWIRILSVEPRAALLQIRLCNLAKRELDSVEILLRCLDTKHDDPLQHYELSRLYRRMNLDVEADRELRVAIEISPSVLWNGLLMKIGFTK